MKDVILLEEKNTKAKILWMNRWIWGKGHTYVLILPSGFQDIIIKLVEHSYLKFQLELAEEETGLWNN